MVEKCCHFFDLMRLFVGANPVRVMASGAIDVNHKDEVYDGKVLCSLYAICEKVWLPRSKSLIFTFELTSIYVFLWFQVPDIIDNAYVIVEFDNGARGMLDLCMFAEGSKNEQEISVVGEIGKVLYTTNFQIFQLDQFH